MLKQNAMHRALTSEAAFHSLRHVMTSEQAREVVWSRITSFVAEDGEASGVAEVARRIRKTERALRYFAAGGRLGKKTVTELSSLFPDVDPVVWLAIMGVEMPAVSRPSRRRRAQERR